MNRIAQALAAAVGVGILGCVTNSAIFNTGGYSTTTAPMLIALSCGLAIGAAVTGIAWRHRRRTLAILLVIALGAGEAYALLMTAERTLTNREGQQAPLRDAMEKRAKASAAVVEAQRSLDAIGDTPRLAAAKGAKATADRAAIEKAAEDGCRQHCRALLEQQVNTAAAEVEAARREVADDRKAAEQRLGAASAALAGIPIPASPTPLADRLSVEAWWIDLLAAGLASIAANGLAASLIAFATHRSTPPAPTTTTTTAKAQIPLIASIPPPPSEPDLAPPPRQAADEADLFARTMFRPAPKGRVRVRDIRTAYHNWCADLDRAPLPDAEIGTALMVLFTRVGLACETSRGDAEIVGMAWTANRPTGDVVTPATGFIDSTPARCVVDGTAGSRLNAALGHRRRRLGPMVTVGKTG
ncbi:MAG: hypothetical protein K8F92_14770 [Hyphomicrobium sp.]|uniref:hypothetical protein n=1 Tax=Hyphomicrobium sp. TaxID=82 RepID=UPI001329520A|nr:hypothetical protein [Hyphomicrobium sp.]KAB2942941.1 MAG: hypothetical protein F9K20_05630 [Hyphomicrobium sp.]MBZ0210895.1 hypothetical protein [Hyphomicrobium sp.]